MRPSIVSNKASSSKLSQSLIETSFKKQQNLEYHFGKLTLINSTFVEGSNIHFNI